MVKKDGLGHAFRSCFIIVRDQMAGARVLGMDEIVCCSDIMALATPYVVIFKVMYVKRVCYLILVNISDIIGKISHCKDTLEGLRVLAMGYGNSNV